MYNPEEDSYFLQEQLRKYLKNKNKNLRILDTGSGTGIQAETCLQARFKNVLASDIDNESLMLLKKKNIPALKSNLFSKIKSKFDLIIFNPPYLPENKYDKLQDTTGGRKGDETILKFLMQAKTHLTSNGKILLLISSLTPKDRISKLIQKLNYKKIKTAEKKLFFETLEVWFISSSSARKQLL